MAFSAKLTVLVTTATKRRLEAEAREKRTSVGDLVRRLLDGEPSVDERFFLEALADWGRHTKGVLERMDATFDDLARERAAWPAREAEIRDATLAALVEGDWPVHAAFTGTSGATKTPRNAGR